MLYKIRIVSDEVDDFRRDILIDSEATFMDLKDIICECTGFDPSQMSSFFICNENWEKYQEITLEDMGADMTKDLYLMADTHLADLIDDVGQKILYTFDYLGDRSLFLQVKDEEFGRDLEKPECVFSRGEAPQQILPVEEIDQLTQAKTASTSDFDTDEDFFGATGYDDEDIAGYDEMNY